jgi:hypothetical protein
MLWKEKLALLKYIKPNSNGWPYISRLSKELFFYEAIFVLAVIFLPGVII